MEKVLILDIATKKTGYAYFENGNLKESGIIKTNKGWQQMAINVDTFITELGKLNQIIVEENIIGRNKKGSITLGKIKGAIEYMYFDTVEFKEINNSSWKKHFDISKGTKGKRGQAPSEVQKERSIKLVKSMFGLDVSDDEADAILLGIYYIEKGYEL